MELLAPDNYVSPLASFCVSRQRRLAESGERRKQELTLADDAVFYGSAMGSSFFVWKARQLLLFPSEL